MHSIKKIDHVSIICTDYRASKKFYTEILKLEIVNEFFRSERNSWKLDLKTDSGDMIELFSFPNPPDRLTYPEAAGLRHLAFAVNDFDSFLDYLRSNNIHHQPERLDEFTQKRFTFIFDPDKLPIEIVESIPFSNENKKENGKIP